MVGEMPEATCLICDRSIDPLAPFFRASGSFLPAGDPLTPFCNVPLHWACYAEWPERPRFAKHYVEAWVKANRKNPFWWSVHNDDSVYISINPQRPIEEAVVRLRAVGSDIRVLLPKWAQWLDDTELVTPGLHEIEKQALDDIRPMLLERFPDDHALVHAIDPDEKRPRAKAKRAAAKT